MKLTIENTHCVVSVDRVDARIWEGHTESGVRVILMVTRISPQTTDASELARFAAELRETRAPSPAAEAIPLRMIL